MEGGARRVSSSARKLIAVGFVCCQRRDRAAWKCALEEPKFRARALNCSLEEFFFFCFVIRILQQLVPKPRVGVLSGHSAWSLQSGRAPHDKQQQCPQCVQSLFLKIQNTTSYYELIHGRVDLQFLGAKLWKLSLSTHDLQ